MHVLHPTYNDIQIHHNIMGTLALATGLVRSKGYATVPRRIAILPSSPILSQNPLGSRAHHHRRATTLEHRVLEKTLPNTNKEA